MSHPFPGCFPFIFLDHWSFAIGKWFRCKAPHKRKSWARGLEGGLKSIDWDSFDGNEPRFVISKERKFWKNCGALNHRHDLRNKCRWSRNSLAAKLATCPADTSVNNTLKLNKTDFCNYKNNWTKQIISVWTEHVFTVARCCKRFKTLKFESMVNLCDCMRTEDVEKVFFARSKARWRHSGLDGPNSHKATSILKAIRLHLISCVSQKGVRQKNRWCGRKQPAAFLLRPSLHVCRCVFQTRCWIFQSENPWCSKRPFRANRAPKCECERPPTNESRKKKKSCHKLFYVAYS